MGHRADFGRIAAAVGLVKPWTATSASEELKSRLNAPIQKIGPYPHAALDLTASPHKKDGTRMIKLECPDCGYVVRTTAKWIDVGMPKCPCGAEMDLA